MKKNDLQRSSDKTMRYQLYGWILFVVCALLFIAASIIDREPLVFAGSVIFLLACLFFLVPLIETFKNDRGGK
jgi:hypothetical protein